MKNTNLKVVYKKGRPTENAELNTQIAVLICDELTQMLHLLEAELLKEGSTKDSESKIKSAW